MQRAGQVYGTWKKNGRKLAILPSMTLDLLLVLMITAYPQIRELALSWDPNTTMHHLLFSCSFFREFVVHNNRASIAVRKQQQACKVRP